MEAVGQKPKDIELPGSLDTIPHGIFSAELSDSQKAGIKYSLIIGRDIQTKFPGIADEYRNGRTLDELIEKYEIHEVYGTTNLSTARMAISNALRGYDGKLAQVTEVEPYPGLIETTELNGIIKKHRATGIEKQMGKQKGIYGQTHEDHIRLGQSAVEKQGGHPYSEDEKKLIEELAKQPEYQRKSRINAQKIATEVNRILHQDGKELRSPRQIVRIYNLMGKSKS